MLVLFMLVLVLAAALAWLGAVYSGFRIVGLAPAGQRLRTMFRLGWWQFAAVRTAAGDAAIPHIRRYISAFLTFFTAVVLLMLISALVAIANQNPAAPETAAAYHVGVPAFRTAERIPAAPRPFRSTLTSSLES